MVWIIEPVARDAVVAAAIGRQWALVANEDLPSLLALVASLPSWLAAMIRARSFAGDDARACALLDDFEHELARITGHAPARWPARLRRSRPPTPTALALPLLDPSQHLMCTGGLARETPATVAALSALLGSAWCDSPRAGLAPGVRARAVGFGLPEPLRTRWRRGAGLDPPDEVVPGEHREAIGVLRQAYLRDASATARLHEVPLPDPTRVRPTALLDLVLATATVRACLRAAGDLGLRSGIELVEPAQASPPAPMSTPARSHSRAA